MKAIFKKLSQAWQSLTNEQILAWNSAALSAIPSVTTNIKLIICASAPQSNGISRAYSKATVFIAPKTPVTTAIALKTDYDAKYGAPSEGAPKVFVKYFYVNTATGEKSGEMLALAKFEADED